MLGFGCSTKCPACNHQFVCCPGNNQRRIQHALSGGGLVLPPLPLPSPQLQQLSPTTPPICYNCSPQQQISPSFPLSFVMPPLAPMPLIQPQSPLPACLLPTFTPIEEVDRLINTVRALRQSGWFYENITYQQSDDMLKNTAVGTFLVRNSSDPNSRFSLSVLTERGPTSVRLQYVNGLFRLNAQSHLQGVMPAFKCVVELVEFYVAQSKSNKRNHQVWVDLHGKLYSVIQLEQPLLKKDTSHSLKHLARLAVHKALQSSCRPKIPLLPSPHTQLDLPVSLTNYLAEYPHWL